MKYICLNAIGGLANRMRAIAAARSLAKDLSCRLAVVWMPLPELNAEFKDLFVASETDFDLLTPTKWQYLIKYSMPRKKNFLIPKLYQKTFFDKVLTDGDCFSQRYEGKELLQLLSKSHSSLIISGLNFYNYDAGDIAKIFRPTEEIRAIVDKYAASFSSPTIGLHIRRTDNDMSIKHSPTELFIAEIDRTIAGCPEANFYLASDDNATKEMLKSKYGDKIITNDVGLDRNDNQSIKSAWVEMLTLARTSRIVGSYYSSFSEMAAMIGNISLSQLRR